MYVHESSLQRLALSLVELSSNVLPPATWEISVPNSRVIWKEAAEPSTPMRDEKRGESQTMAMMRSRGQDQTRL